MTLWQSSWGQWRVCICRFRGKWSEEGCMELLFSCRILLLRDTQSERHVVRKACFSSDQFCVRYPTTMDDIWPVRKRLKTARIHHAFKMRTAPLMETDARMDEVDVCSKKEDIFWAADHKLSRLSLIKWEPFLEHAGLKYSTCYLTYTDCSPLNLYTTFISIYQIVKGDHDTIVLLS